MNVWKQQEIDKLEFVGSIILEHAYIAFEDEKQILQQQFPQATTIYKDKLMMLTSGTHLERNMKETGLLLGPKQKKTGDFKKRESKNQSRHRLIFSCSSNNDDDIDKIFQTQVNKSKVDVNEIPYVVKKTIEKLNDEFGEDVFNNQQQPLSTQNEMHLVPHEVQHVTCQGTTTQMIDQSKPSTSQIHHDISIKHACNDEFESNLTKTHTPNIKEFDVLIHSMLPSTMEVVCVQQEDNKTNVVPTKFQGDIPAKDTIFEKLFKQVVELGKLVKEADLDKVEKACTFTNPEELAAVCTNLGVILDYLHINC
jgi:hypothetical protein